MQLRNHLVVAVLICGLVGPACGKTRECNALAEAANRFTQGMHALEFDGDAELDKQASVFATVAEQAGAAIREVERVTVTDETLRAQAAAYVEMLEGMRAHTTELASLLELAAEARGPLIESTEKAFEATQATILTACTDGPRDDCARLAEVGARQNKEPTNAEAPAMFADYARSLGDLELDDASLHAHVQAHREAVEAYGQAIARNNELDERLADVREKLAEVFATEDRVVGELNASCTGS